MFYKADALCLYYIIVYSFQPYCRLISIPEMYRDMFWY